MAEWQIFTRYDEYWFGRIKENPIFNQLLNPNQQSSEQKNGAGTPSPGQGSEGDKGLSGSDGEGKAGKGSSGQQGSGKGSGDGEMPENFANAVQELIKTPGLQKLTNKDPEMAEEVTKQILEFIGKAQNHIADKKNNPFESEREILEKFKTVTPKTFNENWEETGPFLKKTYKPKQLDSRFYAGQFEKALEQPQKPKKSGKKAGKNIQFDSVKKNLVDKWEKLLREKDEAYEEMVIDELKEQLKAQFKGQLQKMEGLMEMLAPFDFKPGQLFNMAKGEWKKRNLDLVKSYADLLAKDNSIKELADLMGRVSQAEREQERETYMKTTIIPEYKPVHAGKSEIMGVRESDDVANMLSSEMLLLCDPNLELLFYKKFIEKKLQTYEYQGKYMSAREEQNPDVRIKEIEGQRGPYILCVDTSGSMSGGPEVICKVLAFALTKRALAEKRKCYLITFSTSITTFELTDIKNSIQSLLDFLGFSFDGGTNPEPALHEAVRKIESDSSFAKADVLMLSDFEMGHLSDELLNKMKRAKEKKTKFNSLVINNGFDDSSNQGVLDIFDNNWTFDPSNQQSVIDLCKKINPPRHSVWGGPILWTHP